jgi:thiamine biosynthesis lipoprotein
MSSSSSADVRRCRPLLGTFVEIAARHASAEQAHGAVDAAFDEVALIHRRMSFHDPDSDVSLLNREALDHAVAVHRMTFEVLGWARAIAEVSDGCFDVTVAGELVRRGVLPRPRSPHEPSRDGSWRDVELLGGDRVRFRRPLWIDLGGIAKGYAVDRAIERLGALGATQACVNAGGDLRVMGPAIEHVRLRPAAASDRPAPVVALANRSLAGSGGIGARQDLERFPGIHLHGADRRAGRSRAFACVMTDRCVIADALTKVVLGTRSGAAAAILKTYGATAHVYTARTGWYTVGAAG